MTVAPINLQQLRAEWEPQRAATISLLNTGSDGPASITGEQILALIDAAEAAHQFLNAVDPYHLNMEDTPMEAHHERDRTTAHLKDALARFDYGN